MWKTVSTLCRSYGRCNVADMLHGKMHGAGTEVIQCFTLVLTEEKNYVDKVDKQ